MEKQSNYNIWIENILYNTLTNNIILFKKEEIEDIRYYLSNLSEFKNEYSDLFLSFQKLGFIRDNKFNELDYIFLSK